MLMEIPGQQGPLRENSRICSQNVRKSRTIHKAVRSFIFHEHVSLVLSHQNSHSENLKENFFEKTSVVIFRVVVIFELM